MFDYARLNGGFPDTSPQAVHIVSVNKHDVLKDMTPDSQVRFISWALLCMYRSLIQYSEFSYRMVRYSAKKFEISIRLPSPSPSDPNKMRTQAITIDLSDYVDHDYVSSSSLPSSGGSVIVHEQVINTEPELYAEWLKDCKLMSNSNVKERLNPVQ